MSNLTPAFRDYIRYDLMHINPDAAYEFINRLEDPCGNSDPMSEGLTKMLYKLVGNAEGSLQFKKIIEAYAATERPRMNRDLLRLFDRFIDKQFQLEFRRRMDVECSVERTIWVSQTWSLTDFTYLYIGGQATAVWSTAKVLSEQIQAIYPYSGSAYYGSTYVFWIALPAGESPPSDWELNDDPISDPDKRVAVEWTELSNFIDDGWCYQKTFSVTDVSTWTPYYFQTSLGQSEFSAFAPFIDQTDETITAALQMSYGVQASGSISLNGNDVTITATGIPLSQLFLDSTEDFVTVQIDELDQTTCS